MGPIEPTLGHFLKKLTNIWEREADDGEAPGTHNLPTNAPAAVEF